MGSRLLQETLIVPSEAPLSEIIPGTELGGGKKKKRKKGKKKLDDDAPPKGPIVFTVCHSGSVSPS